MVSPKFSRASEWQKRGGVLRYQSDDHGGLIVAPVAISARSYEIEIAFTRLSGSSQFNIDLPVSPGRIVPIALLARRVKVINGATGEASTAKRRFCVQPRQVEQPRLK